MEGARSRPASDAEVPGPTPLEVRVEPTARGRAREALRCPYCRDDATRVVLACARPGCGAHYHAECWDECRTTFGGCAVLGCGSREVRGVGRLRFLGRFVRLLLAAWLFPPRLLRALREGGDARPELRARARRLAAELWSAEAARLPLRLQAVWGALQFVAGLAVLVGVGLLGGAVFRLLYPRTIDAPSGGALALLVLVFAGLVLGGLTTLRVATWPGLFVLLLARAALRGELDLLDRAPTTLDRMKQARGAK
jgi:hypothetical protein